MFEHFRQPLLFFPLFVRRIILCSLFSFSLLAITIIIGGFIFHCLEKWSWIDAFLNAILLMTGCGFNKIITMPMTKIYSSFYILISTIIYYSVLILFFAPLVHRLMHALHLEIENKKYYKKDS